MEKPALATPFRMLIHDVFDIRTRSGPVVTGRIEAGTVKVGDQLVVESPSASLTVRVAAIEKFQENGLLAATAGPEDVGIEITGITVEQAKSAAVLRNLD
jgi:elongation factor Tu